MQDSFTIKQELTFRDFLSSTLYYYFSGKLLKRFFLVLIGVSTLSMILGVVTTSKGIDLKTIVGGFAPILILLLGVIAFAFFTCLYIYRSKPYLFDNVSYDFTHWGIVRHGEKTEFSMAWRDISKIKESKAFFLFCIGNTDFHIIQKRMFANSEELSDFKQLLRGNI